MTTLVTGSGDPMIALATLLLERDELRVELDEQERQAARTEEKRALDEQLHHLHEAANDVRVGAWVQGGITIAGAGASAIGLGLQSAGATEATDAAKVASAAHEPGLDALVRSGRGLSDLAEPIGRLLGEAPRIEDETKAKQAEARRSEAHARAEALAEHQRRVNEGTARSLSALESALDSTAQGQLAIIANV